MSGMNFDIRSIAVNKQQYPDQYLIKAINGGVQGLPPFVAMAAGQMRRQLQTASQGAEAQKGLGAPKVKDKVVSELEPQEHAGLSALPAENMLGIDEEKMLAGGGIIAFADTGLVPDIDEMLKKDKDKDEAPSPLRSRLFGNFGSSLQGFADKSTIVPTKNETPTPDQLTALQKGGPQDSNYIPPAVQAAINAQNAATPRQVGVGAPAGPSAAAANAANVGIGEPPKRVDRFAGLGESQEAFDKKVADEKNAALGEFAMNMGLTMATTVGPLGAAIGKGGLAGLPGLAASRKTIRELEKGRQDYQFNTAKAQAALDQGDEELALKYKELAEKSAYQMGLLAVEKTKAGAYAASVGSKADQSERYKREEILKGFEARLKAMPLYATATPEKRRQMEQEAMTGAIQGYNDATAALSGKAPINVSGISTDAIDAAIARKQKS